MPGPSELLIVLAIILLIFGGSKLAGLGKASGRAIREFREETKGLRHSSTEPEQNAAAASATPDAASAAPVAAPVQTPAPAPESSAGGDKPEGSSQDA